MEEIRILAGLSSSTNNNCICNLMDFKKGKESQLFNNALQNEYNDDYIASQELYGAPPNDVRYKMLKVRLKKKLYNNLFFIDYDKLNFRKLHQAELECLKLLHHSHALLRLNELNLVIHLASKIKKIAYKYELYNYLIDATELELNCYSETGNHKEFKKCSEELRNLLRVKQLQREAQTLFQSIKIDAKRSVKYRRNNLDRFRSIVGNLYEIYTKAKSFEAYNSFYKASLIYHEMIGDFDAIVKLTINSENMVNANLINVNRFDELFNQYILVYAHLRARKYKKGLRYAAEYVNGFKENSPNWYAYLENYFLLALHSGEYELAYTIYHRVSSSASFGKLTASAKERWSLFEAYRSFIDDNHQISNVNPFLLSLPEYSKDKLGFNVAILVLQFIYYLQKKETEALLYRIENLKKYILTHLKDTFSLRSKTFLKLLILTVTEDFDATGSRKRGAKLYQRLIETPIPGDAFAEIEIVPYEHLWEHILAILDTHYE